MAKQNSNTLSLDVQVAGLKKWFPQGKLLDCRGKLLWQCALNPTLLSLPYKIQLYYELTKKPIIKVIDPILERCPQGKLPHVYSVEEQTLCLYYPPKQQWTKDQHLAKTMIVWAADWLYHYENWLITGKWLGGGTHNHDMKSTSEAQEDYSEFKSLL